jgi:NADH dehydrogenase
VYNIEILTGNFEKAMTKNIVIIGGGAGGLELATRLGRSLGKNSLAKITLVDKTLTHIWKPLLHEVAAGTLDSNADELNYVTHAAANHFHFQLGELTGLDRKQKEITLAPIVNPLSHQVIPARSISYDILVIAVGSTANDFQTPGAKEFCFYLDNLQQAEVLHQQILTLLMQAQLQMSAETKPINIAIVGAGATGVELAAELQYALLQATQYGFDKIEQTDITIILIEAAERILPGLSKRISTITLKALEKLKIKVYTNKPVARVTATSLVTQDGTVIPANLKIWAAGIKAPEFLTQLDGLETNRLNQLIVKSSLQTSNDPDIFAFGDCACLMQNTGMPVPPRAQAAHQQATFLAKNLKRFIENKPLLAYQYHDYGSLITISRYETVGNLMGIITRSFLLEGKIARWVYLSLYKEHQKVLLGTWRVALVTLANLLTRRIRPRLKLH